MERNPAVLYFNDKPVEFPAGATLLALLLQQGRDPGLVVVTVDGKFVPSSGYKSFTLAEGARVLARELLSGG